MITVFKYPVKREVSFTLDLPRGAQVLKVAEQDGQPFMWAKVDTDAPLAGQRFLIVGTGHEISRDDSSLPYINTFELGVFVFHVFGGVYA